VLNANPQPTDFLDTDWVDTALTWSMLCTVYFLQLSDQFYTLIITKTSHSISRPRLVLQHPFTTAPPYFKNDSEIFGRSWLQHITSSALPTPPTMLAPFKTTIATPCLEQDNTTIGHLRTQDNIVSVPFRHSGIVRIGQLSMETDTGAARISSNKFQTF
jgi:hypothetical protein